MKVKLEVAVMLALAVLSTAGLARAGVNPGDTVTADQADKVADLVSPGNLMLVKQGMTMKIVPTDRLEWPPPYKSATEKYSPQVSLAPDGTLKGYLAGLPFPLVDANDPNAAIKVMWNFSYRPLYTDDAISKNVEIASYRPGSTPADPVEHLTIGNVGFYNNIGRTEVNPIPTDPEATRGGIRYRFGAYPFLEPSEMRGFGFIRYRSIDPTIEDNSWMMNRRTRHVTRASASELSDVMGLLDTTSGGGAGAGAGTYASNLDPDSFFGFAAKIEDFNYKFLGEKPMLAVVNAENSPAKACPTDGGRTICPENWEMRRLYRYRGGREADFNARKRRFDSEADFLYRLGRMVHHRVRSIRPRGQAVEDDRDVQCVPRPAGSGCAGGDLAVQADVPDGARRRRRDQRLLDRRAVARS